MAPTLFALYINDLAMEINTLSEGVPIDGEYASVLMYADDVVLISESEEGLQKMLDTLNAWSHDWMLALNYDKTKVVHFHRANSPPTQRDFAIGENSIDRDCYYRYLGFEFCDTLDHNHGVNVLNRAASKALGSVTSKYFALDGTSYDVYKNMYDSLVCPVMDYACEIWGVKSYSFVNTTQHRAMRTYLGVGKVTPLPAMYGDIPWITPYTRHRSAAVRYWHRLTGMPETRLTRRVFNWDYELACRGRPSWNKDIHQILTTCDIPELFDQCNWHTCSSDRLVTQMTSKLTQLESRQRSMDGAPMSRLRVYNELDTPTVWGAVCFKSTQFIASSRSSRRIVTLRFETHGTLLYALRFKSDYSTLRHATPGATWTQFWDIRRHLKSIKWPTVSKLLLYHHFVRYEEPRPRSAGGFVTKSFETYSTQCHAVCLKLCISALRRQYTPI